jgi:hypothetical protein
VGQALVKGEKLLTLVFRKSSTDHMFALLLKILVDGKVSQVKIRELPGVPEGRGLVEWLESLNYLDKDLYYSCEPAIEYENLHARNTGYNHVLTEMISATLICRRIFNQKVWHLDIQADTAGYHSLSQYQHVIALSKIKEKLKIKYKLFGQTNRIHVTCGQKPRSQGYTAS